jgi:hypothetical protein
MAILPGTGAQMSFGQVNQAFAPPGTRTPGSAGNAPSGGQNISLSSVLGANPVYGVLQSTGTQISLTVTFGGRSTPYSY